ncbi:RIO1 family regulatory kinase/ATPase domain-containing protein [Thermococcus peptonophilus]|uniref:RIO1 family regulatory kinase/ATPase domain-containing protein n=1 Tax=Thermococcus peptonophilus TaxID=53952 RepID=UPI00346791E1
MGNQALAKKGVIEAISTTQIGVGKDADVYVGVTPSGEKVAVKFNRIGGENGLKKGRLPQSRLPRQAPHQLALRFEADCKKEHEALVLLSPIARVPRPIAWNRHVVVMEFVEGTELAELRDTDLSREEAERILDRVLEEYLKIVHFGIVHSDMSEFNIVLTKDGGDILIIDWAQYITTAHPESYELLKRDIIVLLNAFRRRWRVKKEFEKVWPEFESAGR